MNNYTSLFQQYIAHTDEKKVIKDMLATYFKDKHLATMLDIGCGTGELLSAVFPHVDHIYGIDIENRLKPDVQDNPQFTFQQSDFLAFATEQTFDVILASYVLWEIPQNAWEAFFAKAKSLLNPSGVLLVIDAYGNVGVETAFFGMEEHLTKATERPDWYDYLRDNHISYDNFPFTTSITTATAEEMYDVLRFFFQGEKKEKFYADNKTLLLEKLQQRMVGNTCLVPMKHALDVLHI